MERHTRQVFVGTSPEESKVFLMRPAKGQRAWIISEFVRTDPESGHIALGHLHAAKKS